MTADLPPEELRLVAADDALLDAVSAGRAAPDGAVGELLGGWRAELDAALPPDLPAGVAVLRPGRPRWQRRTAGAAAIVLAVAASTGVAAAATGPDGPLSAINKLIFGTDAPARGDIRAIQVQAYLDDVAHRLARYAAAGGVTTTQRASTSAKLDAARDLLDGDPAAPDGLRSRLESLTERLAALPTLPRHPSGDVDDATGADDHGGSTEPGDDHRDGSGSDDATDGGDDQSDGSGGTSGSDDGSGGSDDGSDGSGSDDSGDDSTGSGDDGSGDSGGDGSDDGVVDGSGDSSGDGGSGSDDESGSSESSGSFSSGDSFSGDDSFSSGDAFDGGDDSGSGELD